MNRYTCMKMLGLIVFLAAPALQAREMDSSALFSLEKVWTAAASGNRQLRLSGLNLDQSKIEVAEAKDRLLPELAVVGDFKLNSKFLIYDRGLFSAPQDVPVSGYGYGLGTNLNFNLFNGGKERRAVAIKREKEIRSGYELALQQNNVKYNAAVAYFELYRLLQFNDLLTAEITAEKKQLVLIGNLSRQGIVLKSDVLRTSVKVSQLELNLSEIDKKITIARYRLNTLMGRDAEAPLDIVDQNGWGPEETSETAYADYEAIALGQSPAVRIVNSDMKLSEQQVKQVKATLLPKVSFYANYNYTYPQISFYPYSNDLWAFGQTGIRAQFSVDNLYKSKHAIAHARVGSDKAAVRAGIQKDEIIIQVKEAYLQQQQALESVKTAEQNIIKSVESDRVIRNSYLNQESLLTDLLEAENGLLEARFNLTTAAVNLKLSHIRLLAIIGIL
ncbi:TolC family protein [Taibaiella chishuiensis]|uniref:Outer membrane protein TolC n=1 Tax=Taibaiella chishuiensis TaxID=1434707 RepID=A0A2P8CVE0_9BACT|nr:TolC family protein [Taibaiella chishuiensis]PSK88910.1 outer membrane protein TolC [Taibaiella chishuiensis]